MLRDRDFSRVVVVGTSCSGKSTLARRLAETLAAPHVQLDLIHWRPGWKPAPEAEFRERVEEAVRAECWIVDGNYRRVRDLVWARATTAVWLHVSLPVALARATTRGIRRSVEGADVFPGCRETLARTFLSHDSLLVWILTSHGRRNRELTALRASGQFPAVSWVEIRRRPEQEELLEEVARWRVVAGSGAGV